MSAEVLPVVELDADQERAVSATGAVFVDAGAGAGKTRVLVERFSRAVLERGVAPDRILAITFTERAAGELVDRIRSRLREADRADLARDLDHAWVSTIHGFCSRILRRHALAAELEPGFRVLDEAAAALLWSEAVEEGLERAADDAVLDAVAAYGLESATALLVAAHTALRGAGRPLAIEVPPAAPLDAALATLREEAAAVLAAEPRGRYGAITADRAAAALRLAEQDDPTALLGLTRFRSQGKDARNAPYDAALEALEHAALEARLASLAPALDRLLASVGAAYRRRKRALGSLDFDDLELEALGLLERDEVVREAVASRFSEVLVDEFQDTNALQARIVDLVSTAATGRFAVGDERQSIYRFRGADVEVFRRRRAEVREAGGAVVSLARNYRSDARVLEAVNALFADGFPRGDEPLVAARPPGDDPGPRVELAVVRGAVARAAGFATARDAEAAWIAGRVRDLIASGACRGGDVAILFEARTDAAVYESALAAARIETVSAVGRDYYDTQAVGDVLAYLRLIRNRYDDIALLHVLASPLVGVTNDGLLDLRDAAPKRAFFYGLENGAPRTLSEADARRVEGFRRRFDRLVADAGRLPLARLVERIVNDHDYDLAVLCRRDGTRRLANLQKLARLARRYEAVRGPSLEGFLDSVQRLGAEGSREAEASVADEGGDAVRLLTVHAAKGLEFPVVILADAGRELGRRRRRPPALLLPDGGLGLQVPDARGVVVDTPDYDEAVEHAETADAQERRRVAYVALTRARERLIVSGCIGTDSPSERSTLGWLLARAGVVSDGRERELELGGSTIALRFPPLPEDDAPDDPGQLSLGLDEVGAIAVPPPAAALPELVPPPSAPPARPLSLTYGALDLHARCGYRFLVERMLGLLAPAADREGAAATRGTALHLALEHVPDGERGRVGEVLADGLPDLPPPVVEEVLELAERYGRSPLAARLLAADVVRREMPFTLAAAGTVVRGRIDVLARTGDAALVVDYKTGRHLEEAADDVRDRIYGLQELVYALAALEGGAEAVDVAFAFLDDDAVAERRFTADDREALAARLEAAVGAAIDGPYPARPEPFLCGTCPAHRTLCAGMALLEDPWHD